MRGVAGEEVLACFEGTLEGGLEEWERSLWIAAGAEHAAMLELDPDVGHRAGARKRSGLVE